MNGRVLGFNTVSGEGHIAGTDGQRYVFSIAEWNQNTQPTSGQHVDFEASDGRALGIYRTPGASGVAIDPFARPGEKSRVTAALLAFFLGGFGIHKFYLGKNTAGVVMLCVWLVGWFLLVLPTIAIGIIAFIEFIIYLTTSDEDFDARYVRGDRAWF